MRVESRTEDERMLPMVEYLGDIIKRELQGEYEGKPPRSWRRKSAEVIVLLIRAGIGLHTLEDLRKRKD